MKKISSIRIKPKFAAILKIFGFLIILFLAIFLFYRYQISTLTKLEYSEEASNKILFSGYKRKVLDIGKSKTLNAAFESEYFKEKYLNNYAKIKYIEQDHLIENINKLLKVGYSNHEINIILSHGTSESVSEFAKRDKVRYLEEYFSYDFAKLENYDRYIQYSDETGEDELETILYINLNLDKPDYEYTELVKDFSIDMLINKHRNLGEDFVPEDLTTIPSEYAAEDDFECSRLALNAFIEMNNAATKEGYSLIINSAYRSYQDQVDLVELYRRSYGDSYVEKYVALPGFSEHQTGLAFDIGSRRSNIFANSKEYVWMKDNAYKYGFVMRYDERYQDLTEFRKEPWHYRYVGKDIAKYIYEHNNMSLEEYFVIFLDK